MDSLGSKAMPETSLITKVFDQKLRALANKVSQYKISKELKVKTTGELHARATTFVVLHGV